MSNMVQILLQCYPFGKTAFYNSSIINSWVDVEGLTENRFNNQDGRVKYKGYCIFCKTCKAESVLQAFLARKSMNSKSQVVLSSFSNFLELQVDTAGNMAMKLLITFGILCTFSNLMELHSYWQLHLLVSIFVELTDDHRVWIQVSSYMYCCITALVCSITVS